MEINREQIRLIITGDMMFKAPLWALMIMAVWGAICFLMLWVLLNFIKPSIDRRVEKAKATSVLIDAGTKIGSLKNNDNDYVSGKQ